MLSSWPSQRRTGLFFQPAGQELFSNHFPSSFLLLNMRKSYRLHKINQTWIAWLEVSRVAVFWWLSASVFPYTADLLFQLIQTFSVFRRCPSLLLRCDIFSLAHCLWLRKHKALVVYLSQKHCLMLPVILQQFGAFQNQIICFPQCPSSPPN